MNVTLSTDDPRSLKALVLSCGASEWLALPGGGYGIPSASHQGAFYAADCSSCSCPDFQYRREVCKHQMAVRIYRIMQAA